MNITNRTTKAELIEYVKYLESEYNRLNSLTFELNTANEDFRRKFEELESSAINKSTLNDLLFKLNAKLINLADSKQVIYNTKYGLFSKKRKLIDAATLNCITLEINYLSTLKSEIENLINKVY